MHVDAIIRSVCQNETEESEKKRSRNISIVFVRKYRGNDGA